MKVKDIDLSNIAIQDNYSRNHYNQHELEQLMVSIKENGLINPIEVTEREDGKYIIISGHRRFKAVTKLGWLTIPCSVIGMKTEDQRIKRNYVENFHRSKPSDLDMGRTVYNLMRDYGLNTTEVSIRLSMPEDKVKTVLHNYKSIPKTYINRIVFSQDDVPGVITSIKANKILLLEKRYSLTNLEIDILFSACLDKRVTTDILNRLVPQLRAGHDFGESMKNILEDKKKYDQKSISLTVKTKKWMELKHQYKLSQKDLIVQAIKTRDTALLKGISAALV